jgi:hypothetical protein
MRRLLLAVFLHVSLPRFLGVVRGMMSVAAGGVGVMGSLLVVPALVMFGGFAMMAGCVGVMLGCLLVVLGCFLGHVVSSDF